MGTYSGILAMILLLLERTVKQCKDEGDAYRYWIDVNRLCKRKRARSGQPYILSLCLALNQYKKVNLLYEWYQSTVPYRPT